MCMGLVQKAGGASFPAPLIQSAMGAKSKPQGALQKGFQGGTPQGALTTMLGN